MTDTAELARRVLQAGSLVRTPGLPPESHQFHDHRAPGVYRRYDVMIFDKFLEGPAPDTPAHVRAEHAAAKAELAAFLGGVPAAPPTAEHPLIAKLRAAGIDPDRLAAALK